MRVALVVSGLPPYARSGVEVHGAALAAALAAEGLEVEVCAPRPLPGLVSLAQRREERDGWAVTWINVDPDDPPDEVERAAALGAFLDRERPDVVHFEDLERIGLCAVQEVENRDLPAVYSAHDWFVLSDQTHLLAPDGEEFAPDDRELEARMALARERLREGQNADPSAVLAVEGELSRDERERMQQLLRGDEDEPDLERARADARTRAERKKVAFIAFGGRYAVTRHLARRLSATLGRAVDWRAPGIDPGPFSGARTRKREDAGLRFGYIGALDRAEGAHLLLEAFAELEPGSATLVIHGDSDEREHLRRLRARARELNVEWGGPFRAEDTPALLASVDVRLIPTLWTGGACFAALEAAAARRPVIAPRSEGLGDAVRDDVDGLLFDPGCAQSLGRALQRFVAEEFLLDRFELDLREPRSIRLEAREWIDTYKQLVKDMAERRPRPELPAHVASFSKRYEALAGRSDRDLLGQVLAGIELLGEQMGLHSNPLDLLLLAAGRGSNLRDAAAADRHLIERLNRNVERLSGTRTELEERANWHVSQLAELRARVEERETALAGQEAEVEQARRARDERRARPDPPLPLVPPTQRRRDSACRRVRRPARPT